MSELNNTNQDQDDLIPFSKVAEKTAAINGNPKVKTEQDWAFDRATWQRYIFTTGLKSGNTPFAPNEAGYADTAPAVNLVSGRAYTGANQLYLKQAAKDRNFPSPEFVTFDQKEKAEQLFGQKIFIKKGEKGLTIDWNEKNAQSPTGWAVKHERLFNVDQFSSPDLLRKYAETMQQEKQEYLKARHGENFVPKAAPAPGPEFVCSSTQPEKYLGQYLAAIESGGSFKVQPVQAKEFAQNMLAKIEERNPKGTMDPFVIPKISRAAREEARAILVNMKSEQQINSGTQRGLEAAAPKQERKREDMSIGR